MKPDRSRWLQLSQRRVRSNQHQYHPAYVVWELTLKCDHACHHCGSRAVVARPDELSTAEALQVVYQLAQMGAKEVVLIGGEAYLHPGFLTIVKALSEAGITPVMTSGGMGITPELAQAMVQAGMRRVSISVDGMQDNHNRMRNRKDSFQQTVAALQAIGAAGMDVSANSNFNRQNQGDLEALYVHLKSLGVRSWQIQITSALGRAADHPEMLFQPWDLIQFVPRVAQLKKQGLQEGLLIMPGNNLGYFGPDEGILRAPMLDKAEYFNGCQAGKFVMGIESNGDVKACPSLQSLSYVGGNLRQQGLAGIWHKSPQLAFRRQKIELWGFCASCPFAETCQAGCNFTAHALLGKPGNNPMCFYRANALAKKGKRERLIMKQSAPGSPFDHALFEIIEEAFDAADPHNPEQSLRMVSS